MGCCNLALSCLGCSRCLQVTFKVQAVPHMQLTHTITSSKLRSPCRWRHTGCSACSSCSSAGVLAGLQLHAGCKRKALVSEASEGGLLHFGIAVNDRSHGMSRCGGASSAWAEHPVHCTAKRGSWPCGMWGRGARSCSAQEGQQSMRLPGEQRDVQRWWARYPTGRHPVASTEPTAGSVYLRHRVRVPRWRRPGRWPGSVFGR